jgi:hypothetical protein
MMKGHPVISRWGGRGKSVLRKEDVLPQAKAKLCFAFAQDPRYIPMVSFLPVRAVGEMWSFAVPDNAPLSNSAGPP